MDHELSHPANGLFVVIIVFPMTSKGMPGITVADSHPDIERRSVLGQVLFSQSAPANLDSLSYRLT